MKEGDILIGEEKFQCSHVEKIPVFAKALNGMRIDPSEFTGPEGVLVLVKEIRCRYKADPGESYCPRHKMEMEIG